MNQNLAKNGTLEASWGEEESHWCVVWKSDGPHYSQIGNIFTPPGGWLTWFIHEPGTWDQPEVKDAHKAEDAWRVHLGEQAIHSFNFYTNGHGGFLQQVGVVPGKLYRLTAYGHAWSNSKIKGHEEAHNDGRWSVGFDKGEAVRVVAGQLPPAPSDPWYDGRDNITLWVGIDPLGGDDPLSSHVIWGAGCHIYNVHDCIPAAEAVAESETMTLFLRYKTRWPYEHNDMYFDDVCLVALEDCQDAISEDEPPVYISALGQNLVRICAPEPLANVALVGGTGNAGMGRLLDGWWHWDFEHDGSQSLRFQADGITERLLHLVSQASGRGKPREQYERTYVLLPPDAGAAWALAVIDARWDSDRWTLGGSADDAGIGDLDVRKVLAVNPSHWSGETSLEEFFATYYPGIEFMPVQAASPAELERILTSYGSADPVHLSMLDARWADYQYKGGLCDTIGHKGCWLTDTAMALRYLKIDIAATPDNVDRTLMASGQQVYEGCEMTWDAMKLLGLEVVKNTTDEAKVQAHLAAGNVAFAEVLPGPEKHFVMLTAYENGGYWSHDPLTDAPGWLDDQYSTVEGYRLVRPYVQTSSFPLRGIHDLTGAYEMKDRGLEGWCCEPLYLGFDTQKITGLQAMADAGIKVILNLRYSWAVDDGGAGTFPPWEDIDRFLVACVLTMEANPAAWGFSLGNEFNNFREWAKDDYIDPGRYIQAYNSLRNSKPDGVRLLPGAIDPFNAQAVEWGDWRQSWHEVLDAISGADGLTFHAYTHGPDPALIYGNRKFSGPPLTGVAYDMRTIQDQIDVVPHRFLDLPFIVTECNHLFTSAGPEHLGWESGNTAWIEEAYQYMAEQHINGVCFYRWSHDSWKLEDKPALIDAIMAGG